MRNYREARKALRQAMTLMAEVDDTLLVALLSEPLELIERRLSGEAPALLEGRDHPISANGGNKDAVSRLPG